MKLKCQLPNAKCPPYQHEGTFVADNATLCRLRPDMKRCARCVAFQSPRCPDFLDDLEQFAAITLIEKGPTIDGGPTGFSLWHITKQTRNALFAERKLSENANRAFFSKK